MADEEPEVRTLIGTEAPEVVELELDDLSKDVDEIDYDKYVEPGCGVGCGGAAGLFALIVFAANIAVPVGQAVLLGYIPLLFITSYWEKRKQVNRVKERLKKAKACDHEEYNDKSICTSCGLADPNLEPSLRRIETSNARSFKFHVGNDTWEIGERVHITSNGETEVLRLSEVEVTSIGDKKKAKLMGEYPRMEPIRSKEKADRISKSIEKMRSRYEKI